MDTLRDALTILNIDTSSSGCYSFFYFCQALLKVINGKLYTGMECGGSAADRQAQRMPEFNGLPTKKKLRKISTKSRQIQDESSFL
jgi:hypothetical protein